MWKPEHRIAADRSGLRYPSDLTGAEWAVVEPMVPPAKHGGRKRTIDVREILNGIFYVLWTGCQWQALPKDLPPKSTVWAYFDLWTWDGTLERIHHALYVAAREQAGREASPTTAIIDSQSVKGAQKGGPLLDPQGFDAGKKITGRKRHILVDTLGLLLRVVVHPANIQDRDGLALVLDRRTRRLFPFIERIYGDGGYQGPKAAKAAAKTGCWTIEIVERSPTAVGFEVLPKRWIVERTFAWLSRFRRLARDFERYARTVAAFIHLAMIRIMLKRLVASSSS
ncbi:MAG TPA: IS5 family transposase [Bradyrhizobium sp.]|nr:IS5 family transposase [Bradyrhizobium sp.]